MKERMKGEGKFASERENIVMYLPSHKQGLTPDAMNVRVQAELHIH